MARTAATFKQADVVRMVKAVRAAGLDVGELEITRDGTIRLKARSSATSSSLEKSPEVLLQEWEAKRNARQA
jgi:hypothetical protein